MFNKLMTQRELSVLNEAGMILREHGHSETFSLVKSAETTELRFRAMWRDAYLIAVVGASNVKGVERTLESYRALGYGNRVPVRAIRSHLEYLQGKGLGPLMDDYRAVLDMDDWLKKDELAELGR